MRTFDSILKHLGHWNKTIDVLKLDIEGAEYLVLEDILEKGLLNEQISNSRKKLLIEYALVVT
ncbi:UNVERIFIED_CONTAM: hypothetical protein NCL1_40689 [Trichonephila clavipes]